MGDDYISIETGTGTSNLNISSVSCGPGHGISIGRLGKNDSVAQVEQIQVTSCHLPILQHIEWCKNQNMAGKLLTI